MKAGLHIPDFTWQGGPPELRVRLGEIAQLAEQAGFDRISVMESGGLAACILHRNLAARQFRLRAWRSFLELSVDKLAYGFRQAALAHGKRHGHSQPRSPVRV